MVIRRHHRTHHDNNPPNVNDPFSSSTTHRSHTHTHHPHPHTHHPHHHTHPKKSKQQRCCQRCCQCCRQCCYQCCCPCTWRSCGKRFVWVVLGWILVVHVLLYLNTNAQWTYFHLYYVFYCRSKFSWTWRRPFTNQLPIRRLLGRLGLWSKTPPTPTVVHVAAKFGRQPQQFQTQVTNHYQRLVNSGVLELDQIHSYDTFPDFILQDGRWKQHLQFYGTTQAPTPVPRSNETTTTTTTSSLPPSYSTTDGSRGGGYWFWKPALLLHHLQHMNDGDYIIYSDVDVISHLSFTAPLLEEMQETGHTLAIYQQDWWERDWNKMDVFAAICGNNADPREDTTGQYSAMWLTLRKTPSTVRLVETWRDWVSNYHYVSDENSTIPNPSFFQEHRHDQSILSLLLKCHYKEPDKVIFDYACLMTWDLVLLKI